MGALYRIQKCNGLRFASGSRSDRGRSPARKEKVPMTRETTSPSCVNSQSRRYANKQKYKKIRVWSGARRLRSNVEGWSFKILLRLAQRWPPKRTMSWAYTHSEMYDFLLTQFIGILFSPRCIKSICSAHIRYSTRRCVAKKSRRNFSRILHCWKDVQLNLR